MKRLGPKEDGKPNYEGFTGAIIRKAWCMENGEEFPDEEPLSAKYILQLATKCGVSIEPPPAFLEFHGEVKTLLKYTETLSKLLDSEMIIPKEKMHHENTEACHRRTHTRQLVRARNRAGDELGTG